MAKIHIVIPARFNSTRFPGKLLKDLAGKPVIAHVVERAQQVTDSVFVATDNEDIYKLASELSVKAVMTSECHNSGTDRIAEAVEKLGFAEDDIVVNLQGDEPLIPEVLLSQVANLLTEYSDAGIATLMQQIKTAHDFLNPNVVKVVKGKKKRALYFSRSPIPFPRDEFKPEMHVMPKGKFYRHIGLYAYRVSTLKAITALSEHPLEALEKLEQLRPLAHGINIVIDHALAEPEHGIDTPEDLERVRLVLANQ